MTKIPLTHWPIAGVSIFYKSSHTRTHMHTHRHTHKHTHTHTRTLTHSHTHSRTFSYAFRLHRCTGSSSCIARHVTLQVPLVDHSLTKLGGPYFQGAPSVRSERKPCSEYQEPPHPPPALPGNKMMTRIQCVWFGGVGVQILK